MTREHWQVRDLRQLVRLNELHSKLNLAYELTSQDMQLLVTLIEKIKRHEDVRLLFFSPARGTPATNSAHLNIALHYRILKERQKEEAAALEVAQAWGLKNPGNVRAIERNHRKVCDETLAEANETGRNTIMQFIAEQIRELKVDSN